MALCPAATGAVAGAAGGVPTPTQAQRADDCGQRGRDAEQGLLVGGAGELGPAVHHCCTCAAAAPYKDGSCSLTALCDAVPGAGACAAGSCTSCVRTAVTAVVCRPAAASSMVSPLLHLASSCQLFAASAARLSFSAARLSFSAAHGSRLHAEHHTSCRPAGSAG